MKNKPHVLESIVYSLCFLVVSFLLPSCGASIYNPKEEKSIENTRQLTHQHAIEHLLSKTYTADNGSIVEFYEQQGKLQADVWIDETQKKPNYKKLPVVISTEIDITQLSNMGKEAEKRLIHMHMPQGSQSGRISIFKSGLVGGVHFADIILKNDTNQDIALTLTRGKSIESYRSIFPQITFSSSDVMPLQDIYVMRDEKITVKAHTQETLLARATSSTRPGDVPPRGSFDLAH